MVLGADSSREIQFFKKEDVYVRWSLREQENKKREHAGLCATIPMEKDLRTAGREGLISAAAGG